MIKRALIILLSLGFWSAASAQSEVGQEPAEQPSVICMPLITAAPDAIVVNYDPFLAGATAEKFVIELTNELEQDCEFDMAVLAEEDQAASLFNVPETGIEIEIRPEVDNPLAQATVKQGIYRISLAADASVKLFFDVTVVKDAVASAGDHTLPLSFQFRAPGGVVVIGDDWLTNLTLRSVPRAQINLSGTSGSFAEFGALSVIDFGVAETGKAKKVFIQLRANTMSQLSIESENGGWLRHKEQPKLGRPVLYTAMLEDEKVDLSELYTKDLAVPQDYQGVSLAFILTLGEIKGAMAGKHEDTLTIEFSPL